MRVIVLLAIASCSPALHTLSSENYLFPNSAQLCMFNQHLQMNYI